MIDTDKYDERIERLEYVLRTLIAWMAGSAASPISMHEASQLLTTLESEKPPPRPISMHEASQLLTTLESEKPPPSDRDKSR